MKDSTRFILCYAIYFLMTSIFSNALFAQLQPPVIATPALIKLQFNDLSGTAVPNAGTGSATFYRSATRPATSTTVPIGVGTSLDFATTPGNYFVQSDATIDALKNLTGFTLAGWINTRSSTTGSGGNRIISWINNGGDGVDLVYQSNGS